MGPVVGPVDVEGRPAPEPLVAAVVSGVHFIEAVLVAARFRVPEAHAVKALLVVRPVVPGNPFHCPP